MTESQDNFAYYVQCDACKQALKIMYKAKDGCWRPVEGIENEISFSDLHRKTCNRYPFLGCFRVFLDDTGKELSRDDPRLKFITNFDDKIASEPYELAAENRGPNVFTKARGLLQGDDSWERSMKENLKSR